MTITANGQSFDLESGTTLPAFLESIGHKVGLVIVERNKQALSPSEAADVTLEDGDTLEVVKIVAGG
ncbi:sulfur carrier protein ThiS [Pelagicoccus mobilis]|uniref:Sulfur carrier protein ThiS n=1 Tax=Pelagicoccus mobilis TaxID=415221 RepID=A0A934S0I3_9BACT|nr:sulfur carrier protein ThiS [Pelagicoccus mobilis]MBK1880076.1 sulfur carrier protein ThiS [Pelagicoccus mobilis]